MQAMHVHGNTYKSVVELHLDGEHHGQWNRRERRMEVGQVDARARVFLLHLFGQNVRRRLRILALGAGRRKLVVVDHLGADQLQRLHQSDTLRTLERGWIALDRTVHAGLGCWGKIKRVVVLGVQR